MKSSTDRKPSFVGTHPTGRKFYANSKTGVPLAFAVFIKHKPNQPGCAYSQFGGRWERVRLIEDRVYPNEKYREAGSYIHSMDMDARRYAEEVAIWFREVIRVEAVVIELAPAKVRAA